MHIMLRVIGEHLTNRVCALEREESSLRELRAQVADEVTALETLRTELTAAVVATHKLMVEALGQVRRVTVRQAPAEQDLVEQPDVPAPRGPYSGKVYLPNTTNTDDQRSPRTPH
jgi:predicted nuclease with TOPRIM domain